MKPSDKLSCVKLLALIEKNPCLWNFKLSEYTNKEKVDKIWRHIAIEMKDSEQNCRDRWNTVRNSFRKWLRPLKIGEKPRKKYYVADQLQFIIPYLKKIPGDFNDNATEESGSSQLKRKTIATTPQPAAFKKIRREISYATDDASTDDLLYDGSQESITQMNGKSTSTFTSHNNVAFRETQTTTSLKDPEVTVVEWVKPKKKRALEDDYNELFVRSLIRYMKQMTDRQNRRFRGKVMGLIDDILENADLNPFS